MFYRKRSRGSAIFRVIQLALVMGFLVGGGTAARVAWIYKQKAAAVDLDLVRQMPQSSIIYDMHGRAIYRYFEENRLLLPEDRVPPLMRDAIVATEDRRFFSHHGLDVLGIVRAAFSNILPGRVFQGASTITQQLARNSIRRMERTWDRKLLELFLALRIEDAYTKQEILLHYLNRIYFGRGLYGVETASRAFFGKSVSQLSLGEAALLAGMVSSPNRFSPWSDAEAARQARQRALERMERAGMITPPERSAAQDEPLVLHPMIVFDGDHYVDEIRRIVGDIIPDRSILSGGLKIFTTIDGDLQSFTGQTLRRHLESLEAEGSVQPAPPHEPTAPPPRLEAAMLLLDPATGATRAMIGGRDYQQSEFNRVTQARRQVGSTLKPLLYAAAFNENGLSPASWIDTTPFDLKRPETAWSASGKSTLRANEALARSDNYAAMRVGLMLGPERIISYARSCGVRNPIPPFPSTFLGAADLSLWELVSLYSIFAAGGVWHQPHLVREIQTPEGIVLFRHQPMTQPAFTPEIAAQITWMLRAAVDNGTGRSIRSKFDFQAPAAGKTGTTNDYKDAWFVGYTTSLVGGVWVGFDQPRTIMEAGYGAKLALPIWAQVFKAISERYPAGQFTFPATLEATHIPDSQGNLQPMLLTPAQRTQSDDPPPFNTSPKQDRPRNFFQRLFGG